jgi:hypothetical protein
MTKACASSYRGFTETLSGGGEKREAKVKERAPRHAAAILSKI